MSVAELPRVTRPDAPWVKHYPPDTKVDYRPEPDTLVNFFGRCVAEYGPREAVEQNDVALTYAELGRRATRMAHALRGLGAGPGVTVALYMPNTPWHPVAFFGILLTGARVTHLSPLDAPLEIAHKLSDSGARLCISLTTPHFAAQLRRQKAEGHLDAAILCDDAVFGGAPAGVAAEDAPWAENAGDVMEGRPDDLAAAVAACPATPEDIALLQYTGGTTGKSKAVMLTTRGELAEGLVGLGVE